MDLSLWRIIITTAKAGWQVTNACVGGLIMHEYDVPRRVSLWPASQQCPRPTKVSNMMINHIQPVRDAASRVPRFVKIVAVIPQRLKPAARRLFVLPWSDCSTPSVTQRGTSCRAISASVSQYVESGAVLDFY
jgi:hypothetical protein